jgi:hypothetical protein
MPFKIIFQHYLSGFLFAGLGVEDTEGQDRQPVVGISD